MSRQSKSILLSGSTFFLAFGVLCLGLPTISNTIMLYLVAYVIPYGLFILFWNLRHYMKRTGRWHHNGTVLLDLLLVGVILLGVGYFILFGGRDLFSATDDPWFLFAWFGGRNAIVLLFFEVVFAIFSKVFNKF